MPMADKKKHRRDKATDTQRTAKGHTIPVPKKKDVLRDLRRAAGTS